MTPFLSPRPRYQSAPVPISTWDFPQIPPSYHVHIWCLIFPPWLRCLWSPSHIPWLAKAPFFLISYIWSNFVKFSSLYLLYLSAVPTVAIPTVTALELSSVFSIPIGCFYFQLILKLHKSCKDNTEFLLVYTSPCFPRVNILQIHSTVIKTKS